MCFWHIMYAHIVMYGTVKIYAAAELLNYYDMTVVASTMQCSMHV